MQRTTSLVIFGLATAALVLAPATTAMADDDPDWSINRYDVTATLDTQGTANVTIIERL